MAAPPRLSQPSMPGLRMTPRHPPRALGGLTTPTRRRTSKGASPAGMSRPPSHRSSLCLSVLVRSGIISRERPTRLATHLTLPSSWTGSHCKAFLVERPAQARLQGDPVRPFRHALWGTPRSRSSARPPAIACLCVVMWNLDRPHCHRAPDDLPAKEDPPWLAPRPGVDARHACPDPRPRSKNPNPDNSRRS